jgi:hypothetical protein
MRFLRTALKIEEQDLIDIKKHALDERLSTSKYFVKVSDFYQKYKSQFKK